MFQREQLYWQQEPDYENDEPTDEEIAELVAQLEDDEENPEFLSRDGMTFCYACGIMACPGEEEFDFCDHRTGAGCYHMKNSDLNDDDWEDWR